MQNFRNLGQLFKIPQYGHVELQASHSPPDRLCDRSANHSYHLVTYTVLIVSELIEYTSLQLY